MYSAMYVRIHRHLNGNNLGLHINNHNDPLFSSKLKQELY